MTFVAADAPVRRPLPDLAARTLVLIAAIKLLAQLSAITRYGWFRDELYYLACADHPAAGYVDHPPLSIWILAAVRALLGESLWAVRLVPALLGAAVVFVSGALARELGGGRFAQALAATAALVAPAYLGTHHIYSMNAFDTLIWTLAFWVVVRALRAGSPRDWILLGVVLGLGLLNKISVLWLGTGLAAGIALAPERAALRTRWPYLAAAIALLLFLPHVLWQVRNGWPTLEFIRNATTGKMASVSILSFWIAQLLTMNPATLPLWLGGLAWCLFSRAGRSSRVLGIAFLVVAAVLLAAGRSRASYLAPAYTALFAAGAVALERLLERRGVRALRVAAFGWLAAAGIALAPFALPVLPVETYIRYARALGMAPSTEENLRVGLLPQHYADMFGWQELADTVARIYQSLPPIERERCGIYAQNYGEAGAVTVLGRRLGLPRAVSGHNNFWLWGPGERGAEVMIVIGGEEADHAQSFEQVERVATSTSKYAMPYEQDLAIYVCRRLRVPIAEVWPRVRFYI